MLKKIVLITTKFLILTNALSWSKIDIKLDFSNISSKNKLYKTYLQNTIFPEVIKKIQNFVFVKSEKKIDGFFESGCDRFIDIPEKYTIPTNSDLIIFIKILDTFENFFAFSAPCAVQEIDNRPIIGMISINKKKINFLKEFSNYFIDSFVHEIFHILAFSPVLYDKFKNSELFIEKIIINNKNRSNFEFYNDYEFSEKKNNLELSKNNFLKKLPEKNSENILYKIKSPRIIYASKNHFNCSSIKSILFENQGTKKSAGSHFEKKIFGNELMTGQMNGNGIISFFTLGFLEDTNWYKIDYTDSQNLSWGKNKGCDFFYSKKCDYEKYDEFCEFEKEKKCSNDFKNKTICKKSVFSDNCILNENENFKSCTHFNFLKDFVFEEASSFSRCFILKNENDDDTKKNIFESACLKTKCIKNKLFVVIKEKEFFCEFGGDFIFENFLIKCPENSKICEDINNTIDCNGRGYSNKNNKCICDFLFTGDHCEKNLPCAENDHFCRFYKLEKKEHHNFL